MACLPTSVINSTNYTCGYSRGGIERVWISLLSGNGSSVFGWEDGYTGFSFVNDPATGKRYLDMDSIVLTPEAIAALGSDGTTFAELRFNKKDGESNFSEERSIGEDGYGHYESSIVLQVPNMNIVSNPTISHIVERGLDFVAIIQTRAVDSQFDNTYHFVGKENGLRFLKVGGATGASISDRNVYNLELNGFEKELSYIVKTDSAFSYNGLPAPIAIIDPNSGINTSNNIIPNFIAGATEVYEGDKVVFTDLSAPNPISWNWNFGDTNTSTEENPVNVYTSAGAYTVSLAASNQYTTAIGIKPSYITVVAKTQTLIGAYQEPTLFSGVQVVAAPLSRIDLVLDGNQSYLSPTPANISQVITDVSGSGDLYIWSPVLTNINGFNSYGDALVVDLDLTTTALSSLVSLNADYASGSITALNNCNGSLTVRGDFDGTLDLESWDNSNAIDTIEIVGGELTILSDSWAGSIPTVAKVTFKPDVLFQQADVDLLILKMADGNWNVNIPNKILDITGASEPPSATSAGAIAFLNGLGVTVITN